VSVFGQQVSEDVLCEGRYFEPSCPQGSLRIISASYGKTDASFCGGSDLQPWSVNCGVDVVEYLRQSCSGKTTCSVKVEGQDVCAGTSKYLQVIWTCDNGIVQNRVNNRDANILVSASADHLLPVALHGLTVGGASLFIFLNPSDGISQVRWYLDRTDLVFWTETTVPFDFNDGRAWVSTTVADGSHRIIAAITFADGTSGSIDATFSVNNGVVKANPALAVDGGSDPFVDQATTVTENGSTNSESKTQIDSIVPWSLFGVGCAVIVVLSTLIVLKKNSGENI